MASPDPVKNLTDEEIRALTEFGDTLGNKGLDTEQPEDLEAIDNHAKAFAASVHGPEYNPKVHHQDSLKEEQYEHERDELRRRLKPVADFATARVVALEREDALKDTGATKPEVHPWIAPAAIVVLTLTIAPTLHDQFFTTLHDEVLAWLASTVCGGFVGTFVVWSLLGSADVTSARTSLNYLGLLAGVGIGVGLGILRIAYATTTGEYVFAIALTITEISTVIAIEFIASAIRGQYHDWHSKQSQLAPIRAELQVARQAQERAEAKVRDAERRCDDHIVYIQRRQIRHFQIDDVYKSAKGVIERAYRERLATNWEIKSASPRGLRRIA